MKQPKKHETDNAILLKIFEQYKTFKDETIAQEKGKTAQF